MIAGIFHQGSGLGDQLMRYITVRTLAEEKGYNWGMLAQGKGFKGDFFEGGWDNFYHDNPVREGWPHAFNNWFEKDVRENGIDIRSYDPEINFVEDNTIVDGSFEDYKYWGHNLDNIDTWLRVEPLDIPDDLCVIGFRGGEYKGFPDLFLPQAYWDSAIAQKRLINPYMRFEVHTDDPVTARKFFPDFPIVENDQLSHSQHSNMGYNWRAMRYAKHAIIANSSFYIIPRLLVHQSGQAHTIAPRYWARHNARVWARPACFYKQFDYIHAPHTD